MRFEISAINSMDRIILTTGVSRKSWILSKMSLKHELKVHVPEREDNSM